MYIIISRCVVHLQRPSQLLFDLIGHTSDKGRCDISDFERGRLNQMEQNKRTFEQTGLESIVSKKEYCEESDKVSIQIGSSSFLNRKDFF